MKRFVVIVVGFALSFVMVPSSAATAQAETKVSVPVPTVEGPITSGNGKIVVQSSNFDLAKVGYEQAEYFISGTAHSYGSAVPLTDDGKWSVTENGSAPFKTRIVVYRPTDPHTFDGTVSVEWLNVTGGLDSGANWTMSHREQIREGMAWVGVTAQKIGIVGGSNKLVASQALLNADPVRYGSLEHPGDQFAYDIYSQAAQAVRKDAATVLGGLTPKRLVAVGESQSAFYLTSYANALARSTEMFDGFLIHSRDGGAALFDGSNATRTSKAPCASAATSASLSSSSPPRAISCNWATCTPDSPTPSTSATGQIAGASHYDTYSLSFGPKDDGTIGADAAFFDTMITTVNSPYPGIVDCAKPINAGGQTYVARAAVAAMNRWVTSGQASPACATAATRREVGGVRARWNGNVVGGIRTPHVDAPIATLSGLGQTGTSFCFLLRYHRTVRRGQRWRGSTGRTRRS